MFTRQALGGAIEEVHIQGLGVLRTETKKSHLVGKVFKLERFENLLEISGKVL